MIKVSVIVPVYNTSKYLKSCITSLLNQTIDKYEIIFVNDCSSDNSIDILKYYEKMYPYKIRVIDLEKNSGVSVARNIGLSYANGEFIYFMDSDDVVSINFLNDFYNICKKEGVDIATSSCFRINKNEKLDENDNIFLGDSSHTARVIDVVKKSHNFKSIGPGVWDKLFKHDIIPDNPFIEGKVFEDIAFVHPLVLKSKDICLWYRDDYAYRYTPNSIMESHYKPKPSLIDIIDVCRYSLEFGKELGLNDEELKLLNDLNKKYLLKKMLMIEGWDIDNSLKKSILTKYGRVCSTLFGEFDDSFLEFYKSLDKYLVPCNNPEFELDVLKKKIKSIY